MSVKKDESPQVEASGEVLPTVGVPDALDTPRNHGLALGLIGGRRSVVFGGRTEEIRSPEYRAAETLHGWAAHALNTADDLLISRDAFKAAIEATKTADARGNYTPHTDALAPHLKKGGAK